MPGPKTSSDALSRADLDAVLWEYYVEQARTNFIGSLLMPPFPVDERASGYPIIPIESVLKRVNARANPDGSYQRIDWQFEEGEYACQKFGLEDATNDDDAAHYDNFFDVEEISGQLVAFKLLLEYEYRVLEVLQDTSTFSENTVDTPWSTVGSSTPAKDIEGHKETMRGKGIRPNLLVISEKVFQYLKDTTDVQDRVKYVMQATNRELNEELLAGYFDIDRVVVARAQYDSTDEGQDYSLSHILGDEYAILAKVAQTQSLKEPCVGRTFHWRGGPTRYPLSTQTYRENRTESNVVRVKHWVDEAVVMADAAMLVDTEQT